MASHALSLDDIEYTRCVSRRVFDIVYGCQASLHSLRGGNETWTSANPRPGQLIKTVLLLGALTALVVGAGSFAAPSYAWAFAIAGVAMNVGSWFFSDRHGAADAAVRGCSTPAESPDLHQMVARAGVGRRHPDAEAVPDRGGLRQRLRHRPQPGARRGRRDAPACSACCRAARCAASSRTRSRTSATAT